jgi:peptidyl-prolyl cis-trans isomerase D
VLDVLRRGSRAVLWVVIIGVGSVFVLYLGFQGGFGSASPGGPVVRAGDYSFDGRDLDRVIQNAAQSYREALGDQFDAEAARSYLVGEAGSALLQQALLAWQGERMGLTASDAEVREYLRQIGFADDAGRLDRDRVTQYAESEFGSVRRFQERLRTDLLADKTARLIHESVAVSEAETRDAVRYQLEEVRIALVKLDGRKLPDTDVVPEEAAQALLQKDPERVRAAYEARKSQFDQREQVRVRHILARFEPGDDAAKQAARERIDALRGRLEGGEDFAAVAKEASDDAATKEAGGDLGLVTRGSVVKPLEDAAFAQAPGVLGEPVESPQGWHLLKVEEHLPARVVPFEEAQAQVAAELTREDAAAAAARARAEKLAEAVRGGKSLVDAAREAGIEILRLDPLRRRPDGYVPQIGVAPDVLAAAFTLTDAAPSDPTVHTVDEQLVLVQLLERKGPSDAEVDEALPATRERLLAQRRNAALQTWIARLRDELSADGELVYDLSAFQS